MALAFVSSTVSANNAVATAVPVAYPASLAAGDILVLLVGTKGFASTITPTIDWRQLGEVTNGTTGQGADTGSVKMAAFITTAAGGETGNLTVPIGSANASYAALYRFTKAAGQTVQPAAVFGVDTTVGTAWSVAFTANPGITSGDHIVLGGVWPSDNASTVSASALAATSATFTGIIAAGDQNPRVTTSNQLGGNTNHCSCSAGTASANPTWTHTQTLATNNAGSAVLVRLREVAPGTLAALATRR